MAEKENFKSHQKWRNPSFLYNNNLFQHINFINYKSALAEEKNK